MSSEAAQQVGDFELQVVHVSSAGLSGGNEAALADFLRQHSYCAVGIALSPSNNTGGTLGEGGQGLSSLVSLLRKVPRSQAVVAGGQQGPRNEDLSRHWRKLHWVKRSGPGDVVLHVFLVYQDQ